LFIGGALPPNFDADRFHDLTVHHVRAMTYGADGLEIGGDGWSFDRARAGDRTVFNS
jgi:hypothetical protein